MERIRHPRRRGTHLGDDGVNEVGSIGADMGDLSTPLRPEQVEELPHGGTVASRCGPHQPACVVVHDDHHVLVALLVRNLIDPDPG